MSEKETLNEVTLLDMLKALMGKWKMLVCITLAALLLCGGLGALVSFVSNQDYGTKIEFYITSEKANRYILSLIQSDSFAEEILMDENSLPADYKDTNEYKSALDIKKQILTLREELETLEEELIHYPRKVSDAQKLSNEAQTAYNEIYNHLTIMYASADAQNYKEQIIKAENDLAKAKTEKDKLKSEYNKILSEHEDKKEAISDKTLEIDDLKEEFSILKESLLVRFRAQPKNETKIIKIKESVTYSYAESQDTDSQAVLYVNVSVRKDAELAEKIAKSIPEKMPGFISENVNQEVNCVNMSAFTTVEKIEDNPLVPTVIKYGCIGAALVLFVTCCGVLAVFLSKSEQRIKIEEEKAE